MGCREIRELLLKIPIVEKLGTMRRNIMHPSKGDKLDIDRIKQIYQEGNNKEKQKSYFIVYSNQVQGGLFVYLVDCMAQIAYAVKNEYIPVVDMLNFPNNLRNENQADRNAWELYFKQPMGVTVQEVYGAQSISFHGEAEEKMLYIGDLEPGRDYEGFQVIIDESKPYEVWLSNQKYMQGFRDFWNKYMRYSDAAQKYIDDNHKKLFEGKKKTLGLLCRGTDYLSLKPKGHYVQPTKGMIVEKVQEVLDITKCDSIFLATEDQDIYNYLMKIFDGKIMALATERVKYKEGYLLKDLYRTQNMNIYQRQLDYLTEMELLSRCQCLIAGKTTGSRFLPVMCQEPYQYLFYWELGRYE